MATFCLPVTYGQSGIKVKFGLSGSGAFPTIARWIVSVMGGEGNSTQVILKKCHCPFIGLASSVYLLNITLRFRPN